MDLLAANVVIRAVKLGRITHALVISGEAGNEIQSPMAVVILGGLLSATLLNLMVILCVYAQLALSNDKKPSGIY